MFLRKQKADVVIHGHWGPTILSGLQSPGASDAGGDRPVSQAVWWEGEAWKQHPVPWGHRFLERLAQGLRGEGWRGVCLAEQAGRGVLSIKSWRTAEYGGSEAWHVCWVRSWKDWWGHLPRRPHQGAWAQHREQRKPLQSKTWRESHFMKTTLKTEWGGGGQAGD